MQRWLVYIDGLRMHGHVYADDALTALRAAHLAYEAKPGEVVEVFKVA